VPRVTQQAAKAVSEALKGAHHLPHLYGGLTRDCIDGFALTSAHFYGSFLDLVLDEDVFVVCAVLTLRLGCGS
jgi:hypothetical protein